MISYEHNQIAKPRPADDVEPLWHVLLPSGMVTVSLDELDAAYQSGSISEQTLVAREDESYLRPLAVVAGLCEPQHRDAPRPDAPGSRSSEISGVRPAAHAQHDARELAPANASTWTLFDRHGHAPPSLAPEPGISWESTPVRWLRQARAALRRLVERATSWFARRSPPERGVLGVILVASLAALCTLWPAQRPPSAAALGSALALQPRSPLVQTAAVASPQKFQPPSSQRPAPASLASRTVEPDAELDVRVARDATRQVSELSERRKAGRSEGSRRSSRKTRTAKHRASRE
jgi:hypothetical protein